MTKSMDSRINKTQIQAKTKKILQILKSPKAEDQKRKRSYKPDRYKIQDNSEITVDIRKQNQRSFSQHSNKQMKILDSFAMKTSNPN